MGKHSKKKPYYIEPDDQHLQCSKCKAGRTWLVVGPGEVALSTMYGDKEEAKDLVYELNKAYSEGFDAALFPDGTPGKPYK